MQSISFDHSLLGHSGITYTANDRNFGSYSHSRSAASTMFSANLRL